MTDYIKKQLICQKQKMCDEYEKIKKKESKYFKTVKEMCEFYNVSRKTFYKWLNRFRESDGDLNSLLPQSRRPKTNCNMPAKDIERIIVKMRKKLGYSGLLISVVLRKRGISKISEFGVYQVFKRYKTGPKFEKKNKKEEPKFYEKESPWELIHIDEKKTKNVKGEDAKQKRYSFKAVDDCTRFKFTKEYPDKTANTSVDFLKYIVDEIKKVDPYAVIGAVLTDNGKNYTCKTKKGREGHLFEKTCIELGIKHKKTKIRRPQTNGKVEYTHWLYDKKFYKKYKFLSFGDRDEKLKEFTNYLNYIKPNIAIGGETPYEKLLKIKSEKTLTEKLDCAIIKTIEKQEVMNKKLAA